MTLIDADEAIINFGFEYEDIPPTQEEFVGFLKRQKTIDAEPRVEATKIVHASWIPYSGTMMECSVCKKHVSRHRYSYCPHCGAKIDEVSK